MPKSKSTSEMPDLLCQLCGKPIVQTGKYRATRKFCGLSCTAKANVKNQQAWEQTVAARLEEDGWRVIRPMSCCDRIGIKNGQVFFLEFKPQGRTKLREYQKLVRDAAPSMYRVVVGTLGSDPTKAQVVKVNSIVGSKPPLRHIRRLRKKTSASTSQFAGVTRKGGVWTARVTLDGRVVNIGSFREERDAAEAYDEALCDHYGRSDMAVNFPVCGL